MMPNYMAQLVLNPRLLEGVLIAPYLQPLMDARTANYYTLRKMVANRGVSRTAEPPQQPIFL
jgi:hypothetical protein